MDLGSRVCPVVHEVQRRASPNTRRTFRPGELSVMAGKLKRAPARRVNKKSMPQMPKSLSHLQISDLIKKHKAVWQAAYSNNDLLNDDETHIIIELLFRTPRTEEEQFQQLEYLLSNPEAFDAFLSGHEFVNQRIQFLACQRDAIATRLGIKPTRRTYCYVHRRTEFNAVEMSARVVGTPIMHRHDDEKISCNTDIA